MASVLARRSVATVRGLSSSASRLGFCGSSSATASILRHTRTQTPRVDSTTLFRSLHASAVRRNANATQMEDEPVGQSDNVTRFAELKERGLVHSALVEELVGKMGLDEMTDIQVGTINECLRGNNVLAQAKTGTGKTLGFLVPTAQRILEKHPELMTPSKSRSHAKNRVDIKALIISPTRELAEQIGVEARRLLARTGLQVQIAVGGTQKRAHLHQMLSEGCHILVATPGRLHDIVSDPMSGVDLNNLEAFVLDEADRLLDDGFAPDVIQISKYFPSNTPLQTLMFSATMQREVLAMVRRFMGQDYKFIKTMQEEEPTHNRVPQKVVQLAGMENTMPALYELVSRDLKAQQGTERPFKAIIFFNSTAEVRLYYSMFRKLSEDQLLPKLSITSMHSKLTQGQRTNNSESFRRATQGLLISSDVSARGMDFPNVTHVIQVGVARDRESYIHRLGRTGRAGKEGEGWLLVHPAEDSLARTMLSGLPVKRNKSLMTAEADMTSDAQLPAELGALLNAANEAARRTRMTDRYEVFRALLGTNARIKDRRDLVNCMNDMSKYSWGMEIPPAISPSLAQKLGMGRLSNVNSDGSAHRQQIREEEEQEQARTDRRNDRRSGFGGRGGFGGGDRGRGFGGGFRGGDRGGFNDSQSFGSRGGFDRRSGGGPKFGGSSGGGNRNRAPSWE